MDEFPEITEPSGMFPTGNLGTYDPETDRAIVFLDNVWDKVIQDGVSIDEVNEFIEILIDVDIHETSHKAMASEMEPRYKKLEKKIRKIVISVNVDNFKKVHKELKKAVSDYTEMLFMEEVYAFSSEKNPNYLNLKSNYNMEHRIEDMIDDLLKGNLKPIHENLANIIAQESERKWNMLNLTFKSRILKIKGGKK